MYAAAFRKKIVELVKNGKNKKEISEMFSVTVRSINIWIKKKDFEKKKQIRKRKINDEEFIQYVIKNPDKTLIEYGNVFGVVGSVIFKKLKCLGFTRKKSKLYIKSETKKNVINS